MGLVSKIKKGFLNFVGNSYVYPKPMFYHYKPDIHKVKGFEIRQVLDILQPGDVLLRRYDGYLNSVFTPGFWSHAGLFAGNGKVIHAVGVGVVEEDILDFCRTDSVAVGRMKKGDPIKAVEIAQQMVEDKIGYDYEFKDENGTVYCTEMVNICYQETFDDSYTNEFGVFALTPDGLFNDNDLEILLDIRHSEGKYEL